MLIHFQTTKRPCNSRNGDGVDLYSTTRAENMFNIWKAGNHNWGLEGTGTFHPMGPVVERAVGNFITFTVIDVEHRACEIDIQLP